MGADIVQNHLMLRDFNAQDNAVCVGNAHGLLTGELPCQVMEAKTKKPSGSVPISTGMNCGELRRCVWIRVSGGCLFGIA